jgi:hypothetical protein
VSTIGMFPSDEHDLKVVLREANELRRAKGLEPLGPWWRLQRRDLHGPHRFVYARCSRLQGILHRP